MADEQDAVVTDEMEKAGAGGGAEEVDDDFLAALNEVDVDIDDFREEPPEDEDKGKKDKGSGDDELAKLKEEVAKLRSDKSDLKRALHEERQEKKRGKGEATDEAATLTDAQLQALLEEHRDDPAVLLNIVKYKVDQVVKGASKDIMADAEMKQKKAQVDSFMKQRYPDYDDEDSDIHKGLAQVKKAMGLEDHPFGDYYAAGVQVLNSLPDIVKHWFEEGKKAAMDEKAEKKREEAINDGKLSPAGRRSDASPEKGNGGLSPTQMETAKRLGFTTAAQLKLYRDQILRNTTGKRKEA